jgi:hypothetical protein
MPTRTKVHIPDFDGALEADLNSDVEAGLAFVRSEGIIIPDPEEVGGYLLAHSDLLSVLSKICAAAASKFGTDAQLSLELYRDPEINDDHLTLYVRQRRYRWDLLDIIDQILLAVEPTFSDKANWFHVTTDFRPPR